jgi:hypothetical protein
MDARDSSSQPGTSPLLSGIVADVRQLMEQQAQLLRLEIREDLRKARTGMILLGASLGIVASGGLLLCFMLPWLLHWLTDWPEWLCCGLFGVLFLALGVLAAYTGFNKLRQSASLSESTAALKENLVCLLRRN